MSVQIRSSFSRIGKLSPRILFHQLLLSSSFIDAIFAGHGLRDWLNQGSGRILEDDYEEVLLIISLLSSSFCVWIPTWPVGTLDQVSPHTFLHQRASLWESLAGGR